MKALDNTKIKPAVDRFVESMLQQEIAYWKERSPERLATLDKEREDRFREHVAGLATQTVKDMESADRLMDRIRRGAFHPDNKITRRLFTDLTGIVLPSTVSGTKQALREYVGTDVYDGYYTEIEEVRAADRRAREEAAQEANALRVEKLKRAIADDTPVSGDELLDVARAVGIEVHPRTAGTLRRRVVEIQSGCGRVRGGQAPDSVWSLYRRVKAAVTA